MKLRIEIDLDNEHHAGNSGSAIARDLRQIAYYVDNRPVELGDSRAIVDPNGNTVGKMTVTED